MKRSRPSEIHFKTKTVFLRFLLFAVTMIYAGVRIAWFQCPPSPPICPNPSNTGTEEESQMCKAVSTMFSSMGFANRSTEDLCEAQEAPLEVTNEIPKKKQTFIKGIISKIKARKDKKKDSSLAENPLLEYHTAYTTNTPLTASEKRFVSDLSKRVYDSIPDFKARAALVPWGGPSGSTSSTEWWQEEGLLRAYGKIMKWPADLKTNFPFHLCSKGCDAEMALGHTLEFREEFRPWLVSPDTIRENRKGYVYFRGYSPTPQREHSGHTMVWFRPGHYKVENPVLYFRAVLNTLERAVTDNLIRSNGKVGKFNVVMDTHGLTFSMLTSFGHVHRAIVMLQDHFPDRLGMIFLANLSKPAEFVFNLVKRVITKEVREKIVILPSDPQLRKALLETVILPQFIPSYVGGKDDYRFDSDDYYPRKYHCTNEEATEYIQTMPYHA